ncbi:peptidoglycan editing factor PgeF [Hyphobacterium sp. HN65]|uniref:Purine nucleoside phosphorylase n=1 Tax=Hyphobacterium lacteum TaxID=3116575 RepID=A0ABU7LQ44_9PROT|nr:peptidoglycan editing factor PgeF [Hyphobacterium sp. HN65]MEE2526031.1 peptidoglycan editing factor PgeF [Hyphobacterium sp. HN65]
MSLPLIQSPILNRPGLVHGFTTRAGGVSTGAFASLNLSRREGDPDANVAENRKRVRAALGVDHLVFARQVHGNRVIMINRAPADGVAGEGDAMITDRPGIGLVAQTADCVPLLIHDPVANTIAAVHSGWRGTVQEIARQAIDALNVAYGSKPADLLAAIGPAISQNNYRVGPEVLEDFVDVFGSLDGLAGPVDAEGGAKLDNTAAVHRQLLEAGIPGTNIWVSDACTFADETLFSCRRAKGGPFGGQGGVIALV